MKRWRRLWKTKLQRPAAATLAESGAPLLNLDREGDVDGARVAFLRLAVERDLFAGATLGGHMPVDETGAGDVEPSPSRCE